MGLHHGFAAVVLSMAALVSSADAGFTMSGTRSSVSGSLDRIELFITNTGGTSGINTAAMQLGGYGVPATPGGSANTTWQMATSPAGSPDAFGQFGSTTASGVRLTATPTDNFLVDYTPRPFGSGSGIVSKTDWGMVWVTLKAASTLNNGTNYKFASLLVDKGAGMHFDVRTGGTTGPAFGLTYDVPAVDGSSGPDITGTGSASIGTTGTNSFFIGVNSPSSLVAGNDGETYSFAAANAAPSVSLALVGDLQNARSNGATVTPENGGYRVNFTTNKAGEVYNLSFRATDLITGATNVETLSLSSVTGVAPEPATLASLAMAGLLGRRRRRA